MSFITKREKIMIGVFGVLIALFCIIGVGSKGADGKWFKNSDMKTWFNSWGKGAIVQVQDNADNQDNNGANVVVDNGAQNGAQNGEQAQNNEQNNGSTAAVTITGSITSVDPESYHIATPCVAAYGMQVGLSDNSTLTVTDVTVAWADQTIVDDITAFVSKINGENNLYLFLVNQDLAGRTVNITVMDSVHDPLVLTL